GAWRHADGALLALPQQGGSAGGPRRAGVERNRRDHRPFGPLASAVARAALVADRRAPRASVRTMAAQRLQGQERVRAARDGSHAWHTAWGWVRPRRGGRDRRNSAVDRHHADRERDWLRARQVTG